MRLTPKQQLIQDHSDRVIDLSKNIRFYKNQVHYWELRKQRGISGAGLKSLSLEKAIDRLTKLDDRLTDALRRSTELHDNGHPEEFENYMKIHDWKETNERQLKALKVSQRKRVNIYEFSYDLLEAVKDRVSIVDMLDELKIRKRRSGGNRYVVICPFHDEDSPSCMIYAQQDKFHCFGCQASGDVIDFYQKYLGLEFDEAMTLLCEKLQIQIMDEEQVDKAEETIQYYTKYLKELQEELNQENINFAKELKAI